MEVSGNFARFVFQTIDKFTSQDRRDATDACKELDGTRLCGNRVKVEMSNGGKGGRGGRGRSRWIVTVVSLATRLSYPERKRAPSPSILLFSQEPIQRRKEPTKEEEQERRPRRKEQEQVGILADMIHSNFFIHPGAQGGAAGARLTGVWAGEGTGASRGAHHPRRGAGDTSSVLFIDQLESRDIWEISQQLLVGLLLQETLAASPDQDLVPALNHWQLDLQLEMLYFITWGFVLTVTWKIMVIIVQQLRTPSLSIWSFILIE